MKTLVLGIDPGVSRASPGAFALVEPSLGPRGASLVYLEDLPLSSDRKGRPILDESAFLAFMDLWRERILVAVIEAPNSHGNEGRASLWRFAQVCAQLPTICRCLGLRVLEVKPSAWKAQMGLTSDKKASLEWARSFFPASPSFERARDHGRAEAAALAVLGVRLIPTLKL